MSLESARQLSLRIGLDWAGQSLPPQATSTVELTQRGQVMTIRVDAPFADDPAPPSPRGSLDGLWKYEVVEVFLASPTSPERYLELELSPHGHYLALLFDQPRERSAVAPPRVSSFDTSRSAGRWTGRATVEIETEALDLRAPTLKANAFRLAGDPRRYELASPLPGRTPDFHQPEHFPELSWSDGV